MGIRDKQHFLKRLRYILKNREFGNIEDIECHRALIECIGIAEGAKGLRGTMEQRDRLKIQLEVANEGLTAAYMKGYAEGKDFYKKQIVEAEALLLDGKYQGDVDKGTHTASYNFSGWFSKVRDYFKRKGE